MESLHSRQAIPGKRSGQNALIHAILNPLNARQSHSVR